MSYYNKIKKETCQYKSKILEKLLKCTVVLHDIALNTDLTQHQRHLFRKKEKQLEQSPLHISTSKNSSNIKKKSSTENKTEIRHIITRSYLKKAEEYEKQFRKIKSMNAESLETNKDIYSNYLHDEIIQHNSDKNIDQNMSKHYDHAQEMTVSTSKEHITVSKSTIEDENRFKTSIDYNNKPQKIFTESITDVQCNNLHPVNVINETNCKVSQEQYMTQTNKDDFLTYEMNKRQDQQNEEIKLSNKTTSITVNSTVQTTDISKLFYSNIKSNYPVISKTDHIIKTLPNLPKTYNGEKSISNKNYKLVVKQNLSKITGNILLKQPVKIINETNNSLQDSIPEQVLSKQNKYHSCNKNIEQTSHIDDIVKKEYHILNNNINLKDEQKSNNEFYSKDTYHRNSYSLMKRRNNIDNNIDINDVNNKIAITFENHILTHQKQSSKLNGEVYKSNIMQGNEKHEEINNNTNNNTNVINKNSLNFKDIGQSCNTGKSIVSVNNDEVIQQNRKRTIEENTKNVNMSNKKFKLNRNSIIQNNCLSDLREYLTNKRSKSYEQKPAFKSKCDNSDNSNYKNDMITNTTENKDIYKKLSDKEEPIFNEALYEKKDAAGIDSVYNNNLHSLNKLRSISEETQHINQIDIHEDTNLKEQYINDVINYEDDCISLFAEEIFDVSHSEDTFLHEKDKSFKSLDIDVSNVMSNNCFNEYVEKNICEFNEEYTEFMENSTETLTISNETKGISNNQCKQTLRTNCVPAPSIKLLQSATKINNVFLTYCFKLLRKGDCYKWHQCRYKHDLKKLMNTIYSKGAKTILEIIQNILVNRFNYFYEQIYMTVLTKLTIEQILTTYQIMLYNTHNLKKQIISFKYIQIIINELLKRQMSIKIIVNRFMEYVMPTKNLKELRNILISAEMYIKPGEYWETLRTLILALQPDRIIINKILNECIKYEKLYNIQDVNNTLINKLEPQLMSTLNKHAMERFKSLLVENNAENCYTAMPIQNIEENLITLKTIDSPDSNSYTNLSQITYPERNITFINETNANKIENHMEKGNLSNDESYKMQLIDNLPDARSVYRDHKLLWKFYADLDRFKKGLAHADYDYVIDILKNYAEKQDKDQLFERSCYNIFQREIKRSEFHSVNIAFRIDN